MIKKNIILGTLAILCTVCLSCRVGDTTNGNGKNEHKNENTIVENIPQPLNMSVFIDLSDRIKKEKDNMVQSDKDQQIISGLVEKFITKQMREGFQKSEDVFQIVFYPAPAGTQELAENLSIDLNGIKGPKKMPLLAFQDSYASNIKKLYDNALSADEYFGSDLWGFFAKDKVSDLYRKGYRNVLIILSDGYVFDANNKIVEGNKYSYILPQTLAVESSCLLPCKISDTDFEVYFIECNANPQTDYPKMKSVLEKWFDEMGISQVDIQDTDLPANTLKHLEKRIFRD